MAHTVFIVLHALSGVVAFGCGVLALRRTAWFAAYYWAMVVMAVTVAAAVAVTWRDLDSVPRLIFVGLLVLAAVMVLRAELARRLLQRGAHPSPAVTGHVGFTLVGLADAFLVVTVLNLGAPGWAMLTVGVVVAVVGHIVVGAAVRRTRVDGVSATSGIGGQGVE